MASIFTSVSFLPRHLRPRLVASIAGILSLSVLALSWYQAKQAAEMALLAHEETLLSTARSIARFIADDSMASRDLIVKHNFAVILDRPVIDLIAVVDRSGRVLRREAEPDAA